MSYQSFEICGYVVKAAIGIKVVEKLEERRLHLSLLTIACVIFGISQLFADYQATLNLQMLINSTLSFIPTLI